MRVAVASLGVLCAILLAYILVQREAAERLG